MHPAGRMDCCRKRAVVQSQPLPSFYKLFQSYPCDPLALVLEDRHQDLVLAYSPIRRKKLKRIVIQFTYRFKSPMMSMTIVYSKKVPIKLICLKNISNRCRAWLDLAPGSELLLCTCSLPILFCFQVTPNGFSHVAMS